MELKVILLDYKSLNQIAEIFNGVRITRYVDENNKNTNNKIFTSKLTETPEEELKTENIHLTYEINEKFYSQRNDILLQVIGSIKTTQITEEVGVIIPMNYIVIRVHENYNPVFIYYLLKSVRFTDILEKLSEGSNSRFVRIPHLKQIKFKIPDIKTQNDYGILMKLLDQKHKLERKQIEINKKLQTAIIMDKLGDKYVKF